MTTQTTKPKQPNRKWDVVEAEKLYLSDNTVSYADLAKKYGVAKNTIQRYATLNKWPERRQNMVENGITQFEDEHAKLIAETNDQHLEYYKNMQKAGNAALLHELEQCTGKDGKLTSSPDIKQLQGAASVLKMGIDGARLVLGLPNVIQGFADKNGNEKESTWVEIIRAIQEADGANTGTKPS